MSAMIERSRSGGEGRRVVTFRCCSERWVGGMNGRGWTDPGRRDQPLSGPRPLTAALSRVRLQQKASKLPRDGDPPMSRWSWSVALQLFGEIPPNPHNSHYCRLGCIHSLDTIQYSLLYVPTRIPAHPILLTILPLAHGTTTVIL